MDLVHAISRSTTHRCLRSLSKTSPPQDGSARKFRANETLMCEKSGGPDRINSGHEISRSRGNTSASRHEARLRNLNSLISIFSSYYSPFKGEPRITDSEVIGLRERHRDNNAVVFIVYFVFFYLCISTSFSYFFVHSHSRSLFRSRFLSLSLSLSLFFSLSLSLSLFCF